MNKTADAMDCSPARIAVTMEAFFEEVVAVVTRGLPVRVPAFGIFGLLAGKGQVEGSTTNYPAFSASRVWRNDLVWLICDQNDAGLGGNRPPNRLARTNDSWRARKRGKDEAVPTKKRLKPIWPTDD